MKLFLLLMTMIGAVVPYVFFIGYFSEQGIVLTSFIAALFVNGAAAGFTVDLLIASVVFWGYLFSQGTEKPWLYIIVNLTIGLSCALPLYCYLTLDRREDQPA